MASIEQIEMERRYAAIVADMNGLVEKYRAIFDWDVPDIDQGLGDRLIVQAMHRALDELGKKLTG
ncbi:hypothetical protein AAKU58_001607 [Oxalobacteraceae bacterium GrIS 1.18]